MADKKISELPLINTISGSIVYVPIVHDGITEKITVENFSKFTNKYAAQTGSANIFTANQTINANLLVTGDSTINSNATIGGNLVVNGKLTAQEIHTEITSASIIFESGSTIFGNSADDTHQFTGVVSINGTTIGAQALNEFTASQLAVNLRIASTTGSINTTTSSFNSEFIKIGSTTSSIHFTTQSLNTQTGSQDLVNLRISSTTGSINTTTSSFDSVFLRISSTTGSINTTTSSFDSVFLGISSVTGAMNTTTSSFNSEFGKIGSTTSSIHFTTQSLNIQTGSQGNLNAQIGIATASLNFTTGALNAFTGSVIGQTNTISTFTASVNFTTQSLNTQTGSQNSINFNISVVTSSIDAHILKQATQTGSQDLVNYNISVVTSSINAHILKQATQTGSQDLINYQNSIITSSYRIELNSIEAYTSSLKNAIIVNGTNVQIVGELDVARLNVQYVSSSVAYSSGSNVFGDQVSDKHEFTGSVNIKDTLFVNGQAIALSELNAFTGSQIGKDLTLSVVTSSIDAHILKQATQTGSQDLVNYNISVVTSSINAHILKQATQTGSQDLVNYNISVVTSSIDAHILKQATQTGSQDLVNLGISIATGSLIGITNGLMALTASMKGQAIVSSSQQIQNYFTFAKTGSANTFYGTQTISGSLNVGVGTSDNTAGDLLVDTANKTVYVGRQSSTSGDNTIFAVRNRLNTNNALYVDPGGTGVVQVTGSLEVTRGVKFGTATGNVEVVGNLVMSTAGNGIDFSAGGNAAGMTSELLNDYETGTWSPQIYYQNSTDQTNSTNVTQIGTYTKIGNMVYVSGVLQWTVTGSPANDNIGIKNLPFASKAATDYFWWGNVQVVNAGAYPTDGYSVVVQQNSTLMLFYDMRSDIGNYGDDIGASGTKTARFSVTYLSAT